MITIKDVILEIEVDGALQVKKKIRNSVIIMLTPPDSKTLEARLRGRGTETEEVIEKRLNRAKEEVQLIPLYDYTVVNNDNMAHECSEDIYAIIKAEHLKSKRTKNIIQKII